MLDPNRKLFRWGPISACPFFMSFTIGAAFTPLKKLLGVCYPESVIIFKDKKVTWLMDAEDFSKSSQDFVQRNIFNNKRKKMYSSE